MAKGNFGERLKRERELREVSLEEITTATRIGPHFLAALENEDWSKLPGGVFKSRFRSLRRPLSRPRRRGVPRRIRCCLQRADCAASRTPRKPYSPSPALGTRGAWGGPARSSCRFGHRRHLRLAVRGCSPHTKGGYGPDG